MSISPNGTIEAHASSAKSKSFCLRDCKICAKANFSVIGLLETLPRDMYQKETWVTIPRNSFA